jgi:hypothetical protein
VTVPAEPILIGGHSVYVKFFAMPRASDDPRRIEGTFTLVGPEGVLTLDALVGPQGNPGEPSPIIRPQWGSTITDADDLPDTATLDESDDGRAWYIDGSWHIYSDDDGDFHVVQGSIPGPPGVTPDISMSAEVIEAEGTVYGDIEVEETGTSSAPNFHFKIPGVVGPEGPASAIELASDYDDSVSAAPGDFLVFGDNDKWKPAQPTLAVPHKYSIPQNSFVDYSGSNTRQLIASLNIPAMPFDWYPDVLGHVYITRGLLSGVGVEVEVRVGITSASTGENEPLCGLALYDPSWALLDSTAVANIIPHFSSPANPNRSISPESSEGRFLSGNPATFYVFLHNTGGFGSYGFAKAGAHLSIDVVPAVD